MGYADLMEAVAGRNSRSNRNSPTQHRGFLAWDHDRSCGRRIKCADWRIYGVEREEGDRRQENGATGLNRAMPDAWGPMPFSRSYRGTWVLDLGRVNRAGGRLAKAHQNRALRPKSRAFFYGLYLPILLSLRLTFSCARFGAAGCWCWVDVHPLEG